MRTIFVNMFNGVSGNMLIGSILDFLHDKEKNIFLSFLKNSKNIFKNLDWIFEEKKEYGIKGTFFDFKVEKEHHHYNIKDVMKIINTLQVSSKVKENALSVFNTLAKAESEIHNVSLEKLHFHEVGQIDAIMDVVSFCFLCELLNVKKIYFDVFKIGNGIIDSAHGKIPLPAPVTALLLKDQKVKKMDNENFEFSTPTGVAILITLGKQIDTFSGKILKVGIGFGSKKLSDRPNYLRTFLIEKESKEVFEEEEICEVKLNVDDAIPEIVAHVSQKMLDEKIIYDYAIYPVNMKKGRNGFVCEYLTSKENLNKVLYLIFKEKLSIGIRISHKIRYKLKRELVVRNNIKGKKIFYPDKIVIEPEFESYKEYARLKNISLKESYEICKNILKE